MWLFCSYAADAQLFLWDLVCNVVASERKEAFRTLCATSIQNPQNIPRNAATMLGKVASLGQAQGMPVVLGLQEWPDDADSVKYKEYTKVLRENHFQFKVGSDSGRGVDSVAIAFSESLCGGADGFAWLTGGTGEGKLDPSKVMAKCVEEEKQADPAHQLTQKDEDALIKTMARKTIACRLGNKLSVIVLHAKEAKSESAINVQASYIAALVVSVPAPAVVCADMNTKSSKFAQLLMAAVNAKCAAQRCGVSVVPDATISETITTSKHRSLLHGQTYDRKKSLKTVALLKDFIIATDGEVAPATIYPHLGPGGDNGVARTLPTSEWPSDHALIWTTFTPKF